MKCYNHQKMSAIGICKNCFKALCVDCSTDVGGGLACKNSCEPAVLSLNESIERSKSSHLKTGKAYFRNAIIYGLLGSFFLIYGIISYFLDSGFMLFLMVPGGIIFIIGALFNYSNSRKYTKSS